MPYGLPFTGFSALTYGIIGITTLIGGGVALLVSKIRRK